MHVATTPFRVVVGAEHEDWRLSPPQAEPIAPTRRLLAKLRWTAIPATVRTLEDWRVQSQHRPSLSRKCLRGVANWSSSKRDHSKHRGRQVRLPGSSFSFPRRMNLATLHLLPTRSPTATWNSRSGLPSKTAIGVSRFRHISLNIQTGLLLHSPDSKLMKLKRERNSSRSIQLETRGRQILRNYFRRVQPQGSEMRISRRSAAISCGVRATKSSLAIGTAFRRQKVRAISAIWAAAPQAWTSCPRSSASMWQS